MGRTSSKEQTNEVQEQQVNSGNFYQYSSETQPSSTRATSESESMARDIKEGRLSGYVGNGTVLTGETDFQSMLRIDGHLTGKVFSESGTLIIGSTGRVDANISVASALVNGTVNGDIIASEKIELGRTARVVGNIQTPRIVIEDGAVFEGGCTMLKAKEALDKRVSSTGNYDSYEKKSVAEAEDENVEELTDAAAS